MGTIMLVAVEFSCVNSRLSPGATKQAVKRRAGERTGSALLLQTLLGALFFTYKLLSSYYCSHEIRKTGGRGREKEQPLDHAAN